MRTVVLGKKIANIYDVNRNWKSIECEGGNTKTVYTDRPTLTKTPCIKEWVEIFSYDGEPRYNIDMSLYSFCNGHKFNISEDETVVVTNGIFRADLNEMHLQTNKVVEEVDINKSESEEFLSEQIHAFNSMMITSNEKLKTYCDIHSLNYGDTDAIELFKIVFPDEQYEIIDGVMMAKNKDKKTKQNRNSSFVQETIDTFTTASDYYRWVISN